MNVLNIVNTNNEGVLDLSKLVIQPKVEELDVPMEQFRNSTVMENNYYMLDEGMKQILEIDLLTQEFRVLTNLDETTSYISGFSSGNGYLLVNYDDYSLLIDIKTGKERTLSNNGSNLAIQDKYLLKSDKEYTIIYPFSDWKFM